MRRNDAEFDALLRSWALRLDREIASEDEDWGERVPERLDRRIAALCAGAVPAAAAACALPHAAAVTAKTVSKLSGGRLLALILAAAVAVSAGAGAAIPSVRETLRTAFTAAPAQNTAQPETVSIAEYQIPSPGAEFTVTDEAAGESMVYRWFSSPERELLVEVAERLADDRTDAAGEVVSVGGLIGTYSDGGGTRLLILREGGRWLLLEAWGWEKEALLDYAERMIEANK